MKRDVCVQISSSITTYSDAVTSIYFLACILAALHYRKFWKHVGYHYRKLFSFISERILDIITENSNWNTGEGLQATIALPVYGLWTDLCSRFVHSFQIKSVLKIMEITHMKTNRGNKAIIVDEYMYRRINVIKMVASYIYMQHKKELYEVDNNRFWGCCNH